MSRTTLIGAGIAVLFGTTSAIAHHPGGSGNSGGAGAINTISATTLGQGESSVSVMFELIKLDAFSNAKLLDLASKHVHGHSLDAILAPAVSWSYGITNDLTVSLRLPFVSRTNIREGHHHHHNGHSENEVHERGDASGIGDASTLLQWRVLNNRATGTEWALLGGLKAPTGASGRADGEGELFEAEFQPGSGSWDWMVGTAVTQRMGAWAFDANVLYTLVTTGKQDTDLGDRFHYNLGVSYRMTGGTSGGYRPMKAGALPEPMYHGGKSRPAAAEAVAHVEPRRGPALDLVLEVNGEWHASERTAGVREENSGGNVIYLSPGLRLSSDRWSGYLSVGVPIATSMNGEQVVPDYRLVTGVSVGF